MRQTRLLIVYWPAGRNVELCGAKRVLILRVGVALPVDGSHGPGNTDTFSNTMCSYILRLNHLKQLVFKQERRREKDMREMIYISYEFIPRKTLTALEPVTLPTEASAVSSSMAAVFEAKVSRKKAYWSKTFSINGFH